MGFLSYFLLRGVLEQLPALVIMLIISLLSIIFSFALFRMILAYSEIAANLRGRKIDILLPHA